MKTICGRKLIAFKGSSSIFLEKNGERSQWGEKSLDEKIFKEVTMFEVPVESDEHTEKSFLHPGS